MTVRLDQNTKCGKWEMLFEIQMYALHECIMIVLHFNGTRSERVQSLAQDLCYASNTLGKDQGLLPQIYFLLFSVIKRSTHEHNNNSNNNSSFILKSA